MDDDRSVGSGEIHGLGLVGIQRRRRSLAVHAVPEDEVMGRRGLSVVFVLLRQIPVRMAVAVGGGSGKDDGFGLHHLRPAV